MSAVLDDPASSRALEEVKIDDFEYYNPIDLVMDTEEANSSVNNKETATRVRTQANWKENEIKLLLRLYEDNQDQFASTTTKKIVWQQIATAFAGKFDYKQCDRKFQTLRNRWIKLCENKSLRKQRRKTTIFKYFDEMEHLLGKSREIAEDLSAKSNRGARKCENIAFLSTSAFPHPTCPITSPNQSTLLEAPRDEAEHTETSCTQNPSSSARLVSPPPTSSFAASAPHFQSSIHFKGSPEDTSNSDLGETPSNRSVIQLMRNNERARQERHREQMRKHDQTIYVLNRMANVMENFQELLIRR